MKDLLSIFRPAYRSRLVALAVLLIGMIAVVDWLTTPYLSLGFMYLFPMIVLGGFLSRTQIIAAGIVCAVLAEVFSNLPENQAVVRLILSSAGFIGTGLFISEMIRNRRIVMTHVEELEGQIKLRQDAEEQLRGLVESSPAAIVTVGSEGDILLSNGAAQQLLAPGGPPLPGAHISTYLPALETVLKSRRSRSFRTALQCTGRRGGDEIFLAGIWFSTYKTIAGPRLSAIVVDLSEDLRNREDLSLEYLLKNSKILMSAVAHEIRNLCSAVLVVYENLTKVRGLASHEDFRALGGLIQSLERVSALELGSTSAQSGERVELTSVLDEVRVLIETACHESGIAVHWAVQESLPLVWADRYGLIQVFLNLSKNSQRAMDATLRKDLHISAHEEEGAVVIRFQDSGTGVSSPENLFRQFQPGAKSTGLGLYVSRAIMRSFGGDLKYEPASEGCCFVIVVPLHAMSEEAVNA